MEELKLEPLKKKRFTPGPKIRWVRRVLFLLAGLLIFISASFFVAFKVTATSEFCIKCHEERPEYVTWQASTHSQFECVTCHIEPGLQSALTTQVRGVSILLTHLTQPNSTPINISFPVKNSVCMSCHSANRNITPSGDLLVPHDIHDRQGIACVECHSGVAHGNIVGRGIREKVDLADWTASFGQKQMVAKYINPPMDACLNCHSLRNVTTKCSICHSKVVIPDNHKATPWLNQGQHGVDAQKGVRECHKCHSYSFTGAYQPEGMVVKDYIQQNEFCIDCHSFSRPPSHGKSQEDWLPVHHNKAYDKGLKNCITCHVVDKPKVETKNTIKVYCNSCHWFSPLNP